MLQTNLRLILAGRICDTSFALVSISFLIAWSAPNSNASTSISALFMACISLTPGPGDYLHGFLSQIRRLFRTKGGILVIRLKRIYPPGFCQPDTKGKGYGLSRMGYAVSRRPLARSLNTVSASTKISSPRPDVHNYFDPYSKL